MAERIYKYPIEITGMQSIRAYEGATPIAFQLQGGIPMVWCIVDDNAKEADLWLYVYGTGQKTGNHAYVGTIQKDGFVWHLFF